MVALRAGRRDSWRARVISRGPDPLLVVELLQSAKAALAGVLAWVIALDVLGLEQPFLAPWAAVLVVQATVFRTVSRGGPREPARLATSARPRCLGTCRRALHRSAAWVGLV
ncbi:MAG: hypothetical protein ABIW17_04250 [Marmoricola sp.]